MIGFDEAIALLLDAARPLASENVPITEAGGRVLAESVVAAVSSPPCDCSAMDGYAVRDADLESLPARLEVVGESFAGYGFEGDFGPGQCIRIFTGAPVPAGADRVVIQEDVRRDGAFAGIADTPGQSRHIRRQGSDFEAGERLVEAGRRLDPRALVAAAAADLSELRAWRRPLVAIVSTGDELVDPGQARSHPGAIPESVSFGIEALAGRWGGAARRCGRLADDLPSLERAAAELLRSADLVVVTGGASVGDRDYAKAMFEPHGLELIFSKVAIKPGKPVWLGRAGDRLVLGLPGNPTSALVTGRLFLAPLVAGLAGLDPAAALRWRRIVLAAALEPCGGRETFVRASLSDGRANPLSNQDSGAQKMLVDADLLIRRRAHAPAAAAGDEIDAIDF
jgi:molybdopterin molybdotransferase